MVGSECFLAECNQAHIYPCYQSPLMEHFLLGMILFAGWQSLKRNFLPKNNALLNRKFCPFSFEINIEINHPACISKETFLHSISIKNAEKELPFLIHPHSPIFEAAYVHLLVEYPLERPTQVSLVSETSRPWSRSELVKTVSNVYQAIYREEEETATTKTIPIEDRGLCINRNQTNGKYGIWGHDIEDLNLQSLLIHQISPDEVIVELMVNS